MPRFIALRSTRLVCLTVFALLFCLGGAAQTYAATEPVLIKSFEPTPFDPPIGSGPTELTNVDGTVFFVIRGRRELWKSDGTPAGTVLVRDFREADCLVPSHLTSANHLLFFVGATATNGRELWRSDGTPAGTFPLTSLHPGACVVAGPKILTSVGNKLFFDGGVSDGTIAGTSMAVRPGLQNLTNVNGTLFYGKLAFDVCQLWKSDGTPAGTVMVKDINPNGCRDAFDLPAGEEFPTEWANVNGTLFFKVNDGINGLELWKSDGTEAGTVLVKDIIPGPVGSGPFELTAVGRMLYFGAYVSEYRTALWKSDGTATGTKQVKDISCSDRLTDLNGTLVFRGCDELHGQELWKSDGTEAGTVLVKDINPGLPDSSPRGMISVDGVLYFAAEDGTHGLELWRSDGTAGGTALVRDLNPGAGSSGNGDYGWITNENGTVFFSAYDGTRPGLWRLGPVRSDFKNAVQFCKAKRDFLGQDAFGRKYGANGSGSNAQGKCVSRNR